jgi:hypothetical protein
MSTKIYLRRSLHKKMLHFQGHCLMTMRQVLVDQIWGRVQYFSFPHRFHLESTGMDRNPQEWTGILRNGPESTGIGPESTGIDQNPQE